MGFSIYDLESLWLDFEKIGAPRCALGVGFWVGFVPKGQYYPLGTSVMCNVVPLTVGA